MMAHRNRKRRIQSQVLLSCCLVCKCASCAVGVWNRPACFFSAGEQYAQSLCMQPGEGVSS